MSLTTPQVPVFSQADSNALLTFFVEKIRTIKGNISPPSLYNLACNLPPPHTRSSFKPVTLYDVSVLLNKMKPSFSPTDVTNAAAQLLICTQKRAHIRSSPRIYLWSDSSPCTCPYSEVSKSEIVGWSSYTLLHSRGLFVSGSGPQTLPCLLH